MNLKPLLNFSSFTLYNYLLISYYIIKNIINTVNNQKFILPTTIFLNHTFFLLIDNELVSESGN